MLSIDTSGRAYARTPPAAPHAPLPQKVEYSQPRPPSHGHTPQPAQLGGHSGLYTGAPEI